MPYHPHQGMQYMYYKSHLRRTRVATEVSHHDTTGSRSASRIVQKFCVSTKAQWKGHTMLKSERPNQASIPPVIRGPTINDLFPKLTNVKYLSLTDASSRYHNLRVDEKSSYSTIFSCEFAR